MTQLNSTNFKIIIDEQEVTDIAFDSVYLNHDTLKKRSDIAFQTKSTQTINVKDKLQVYYDGKLEIDGEVVEVVKNANNRNIVGISVDIIKPKYRWALEVVSNWGGGVFVLLALICNRQAGIGFILCNYGFYLFRKEIDANK